MQALNELIYIYIDTNQLECKHNYTINVNLRFNAFFIVTTIQGLFQTIPLEHFCKYFREFHTYRAYYLAIFLVKNSFYIMDVVINFNYVLYVAWIIIGYINKSLFKWYCIENQIMHTIYSWIIKRLVSVLLFICNNLTCLKHFNVTVSYKTVRHI
jgi:hypothetical protein